MSESKNNRSRRLYVRLTDKEFDHINKQFAKTTHQHLSEYLRKVLLNKPVQVKYRNQSLDDLMAELIVLREELNAIGNNYNQVVKRLHLLRDVPEILGWMALNESAQKIMLNKVSEIKSKINQINDQWLQG
ncbi:MAG: plasmid mobilization relaxosome protein MobC [Sphingobacteriales bacterium]|nr:plasmid mobilization relaxosome protein MobC [Sphingobacteriales bacterium]OJW01945.1 MAG: mobilization protein [Sphingobacteriales bacterium 44-61]